MAKNIVKNIDKVIKDIEKFGIDAKQEISFITQDVAGTIKLDAKNNANRLGVKDRGDLVQGIEEVRVTDTNYKIEARAKYSAFMEFGTGTKVRVPKEMQEIASQFKGKKEGSFSDALKFIREWCKRKGIDESAAYPILISILNKGIEARPYLYPAFVKGRKEYLKALKDLLNTLSKKV